MKSEARTQQRMTAAERREEIIAAAVGEFAVRGYEGASTERIARAAGVSQPYIFRLFGTKRDLFLAAVHWDFDRAEEAFRLAAETATGDVLEAMGEAYGRFLARETELQLQLQAYAASADPEIAAAVRARFARLVLVVQELSGASVARLRDFFAMGMLLNVAAALNLHDLFLSEDWLQRCLPPRT